MNISHKFYFITDDFEVIDKLRKLPATIITQNQQVLQNIQEQAYGKDYGIIFGDNEFTYLTYKFGAIEDPGLLMIYVKNEDIIFLKNYVEHGQDVFPDENIRGMMLDTLVVLISSK